MRVFKEAVLIKNDLGLIELISFFDSITKRYGINVYFHDKLVEIIQPLDVEPRRNQMRYPLKFSKRYPWRYEISEKNNNKAKRKFKKTHNRANRILSQRDQCCFAALYFITIPPFESCCAKSSARSIEAIPLLNKCRPLPKITGATPIRYSSK